MVSFGSIEKCRFCLLHVAFHSFYVTPKLMTGGDYVHAVDMSLKWVSRIDRKTKTPEQAGTNQWKLTIE